MTILTVIVTSFFAGLISGIAAHKLAHKHEIDRIKQDAKKALAAEANDSYGRGYMRCYAVEVVRRKRNGAYDPDKTALIGLAR